MTRKLSYQEHKKRGTMHRLHGNTSYEQQAKPKPPKAKSPEKPKTPEGIAIIKHTCGHIVSHNLKSTPPSERSNVRAKLADDLCKNCILALKRETAKRFNADLPPLEGTKDDILDGGRARYYMLPKIKEELRQQVVSYQIAVQEGTLSQRKAEQMEELLLRAERSMLRQKAGKWWLHMYNDLSEPRLIVRYLLHKTIQGDKKKAANGRHGLSRSD